MSAVGRLYRYVAAAGKLTGRYGQTVTVLKWHRARILVRFPDGLKVITANHCLRKLPEVGLFQEEDASR
ncbi:MAG: hypothetical protein Q7T05_00410 [Dehalococcoidia bacterium]|nr:hypothetical protein [Dehalococcoidia bacterium]